MRPNLWTVPPGGDDPLPPSDDEPPQGVGGGENAYRELMSTVRPAARAESGGAAAKDTSPLYIERIRSCQGMQNQIVSVSCPLEKLLCY